MLNKRRVCKNQPCFDGYPMISNCQKVNPRKRCLLAESLLLGFWLSIYWECHHPNWVWLIFFRGVGIPPTSLFCWAKSPILSMWNPILISISISSIQLIASGERPRLRRSEQSEKTWRSSSIHSQGFTCPLCLESLMGYDMYDFMITRSSISYWESNPLSGR